MDQHGAAAPPRPAKPGGPPGRAARVAPRSSRAPLVSLEQPRPDCERRLNTYVEAPPRGPIRPARPPPAPAPGAAAPKQPRAPVTAQPHKHQPGERSPGQARLQHPGDADSIICSECSRCRCAACAQPRSLPSRWLGDYCFCSAETAIDYTSCMCCAKALFYHCYREGDSTDCADEPCSCTGSKRGQRWGCLAALTVVLPCLLCYWPLRGAAALCANVYARTGRSGCRCRPPAPDKLPLTPPPPAY